jgi:hypothetical protein
VEINTLKYSWVKATSVSVRLRISLCALTNTNSDAIPKGPVLEEEPQEAEAAMPSNDVQGRPLCIPMLFKCIMNYGYLLHHYVTI